MRGGRSIPLKDFCRIIQGGRLGLSGNDFVPEGFPAYGAGGVNGYLATYEFDEPAVVLSAIGARCGKCFFADGKWISLANTQLIFPDPARADCKFLWYQLNDEKRWHRSGTGQPFIKPSDVKAHRVFLPPLPTQRRIAEILDKADALRAKRRAAVAQLDTLTQSILLEALGDVARWPSSRLSELCEDSAPITYGILQPGQPIVGGIPYVRPSEIQDGRINVWSLRRTTPEIAERYRKSSLKSGDILITIVGTIGSVAVVPKELEGANITQSSARVRICEQRADRRFVELFLRSHLAKRQYDQSRLGVAVERLNLHHVRDLKVPMLPIELQRKVARTVRGVDRLDLVLRDSLHWMDSFVESLQHRAFRDGL